MGYRHDYILHGSYNNLHYGILHSSIVNYPTSSCGRSYIGALSTRWFGSAPRLGGILEELLPEHGRQGHRDSCMLLAMVSYISIVLLTSI